MTVDLNRISPVDLEVTAEEVSHVAARTLLNVVSFGTAGEVFDLILGAPARRRAENRLAMVEQTLSRLLERDHALASRLVNDDAFLSVLIAALRASQQTHHDEKLRMLDAAIENSALGAGVSVDMQLTFVRFVDELTPAHFTLLSYLALNSATIGRFSSFAQLRGDFLSSTATVASPDEFRLLCNDPQSRALVRFSDSMRDDEGLVERRTRIVTEGAANTGVMIQATTLGVDLLAFVRSPENLKRGESVSGGLRTSTNFSTNAAKA